MAVIDLSMQGWHQATKGKWPAEMDNRKKMAELEEKYDMKTGCLPMSAYMYSALTREHE